MYCSSVKHMLKSRRRMAYALSDAETFDISGNRAEAPNLGFGYGVQSYPGAALARMGGAIALDRLLDLMPSCTVDWERCRRVDMIKVAGWPNIAVKVQR